MNDYKKCLFIGCNSGVSKSGRPYFIVYCGTPLEDKDGNSIGVGYRPITFSVNKSEYTDFASLGEGCQVLLDYQSYKDEKGVYRYLLKKYEI